MWALARFLHRNKRMRQAAVPAAIDQVKGRRTNYSFCRREKGRILQTIYAPLPVVDVHSNFASGKTARFISSPKTEYDSVPPPFPLGVADNCKARPTSLWPSKTMQNDNRAERKYGIPRSPGHRAATDAHSNMTILVRVPHHTPIAPRQGCTVKPPRALPYTTSPLVGVREGV